MIDTVKQVSITIDMWTSISNNSYLTVTCHFIFNNIFTPCVLETLIVATAHTSENIANLLNKKKCKAIVTHFKTSTKASDKLHDIQIRQGKTPKKVTREIVTCWNSYLNMIRRLLE
ncbi:uncharacterized protein [Centruroides vittatus]|uniref:uncharacterized protein n=1 Tax=Centruroides vittatus TaxID=120091 RepID=UPI00350EC0B8